jgi:hypothetical protein
MYTQLLLSQAYIQNHVIQISQKIREEWGDTMQNTQFANKWLTKDVKKKEYVLMNKLLMGSYEFPQTSSFFSESSYCFLFAIRTQ